MKFLIYLSALAFASSTFAQKADPLEKLEKAIDRSDDEKETAKAIEVTEVTEVTEEARKEAGPEKVTLHHIKPGGSLTAVSEEAYGRTRYWRILKLYNKVDPSKLQVGQEIKAPDIPWLLASSGLQEKFPKAVENILSAKQLLTEVEDKGTKPTEEDLKQIQKAAALVRETQTLLSKKTPGVTGRPNATLQQLRTVYANLLHVANNTKKGRTDPNSLAHEHLSNAIVYGVLWAQGGFK